MRRRCARDIVGDRRNHFEIFEGQQQERTRFAQLQIRCVEGDNERNGTEESVFGQTEPIYCWCNGCRLVGFDDSASFHCFFI